MPHDCDEYIRNLTEDLRNSVNANSAENISNTPDYVMADFLTHCLAALQIAVKQRDRWYGVSLQPGRMINVENLADVLAKIRERSDHDDHDFVVAEWIIKHWQPMFDPTDGFPA